MELPIEIKPLKRKDLRELLLIAKVYYPTEPWLTLDWLAAMERHTVTTLTVRWNGRIVGGALVTPNRAPNVTLSFLVVDRNVTRRGIGERLFTSIERALPPGTQLWHFVADKKSFQPTIKFMSKVRMERAGSLSKWFEGRTDALAYSKKIR